MTHTAHHYRRYAQLAAVCAKHDLGWVFDKIGLGRLLASGADRERRTSSRTLAERIRDCLEELGPTYVKLGQIMSTRPDLIPRDVIAELKKLQDHVSQFSWEEAMATVEEDLGGAIEDKFARFDETPVAAASIAQVYRAALVDGSEVAVKVQRPGIEAVIREDISILYDMARLMRSLSSISDMADPVLIVREFERSILREVDFLNEAHLTEEFRKNLAGFPGVCIAEVRWDHTTRRVLTMDYFDGIKVSDIREIKARGYDRNKLATLLAQVTLHTVFKDGLFHADPHPGNLLVLPDQRLAIIDFGMVGRFDRQTMQMLRGVAFAMAQADYDALARALLQHGLVDWDVDLRHLSRRLREVFRAITGDASLAKQSEALMDFLVQEKLYYQPDLILLDKTFGTLDGTIRTLCPDLEIGRIFAEFSPDLGQSMLSPQKLAEELLARLWTMEDVLIDTPPLIHRVLGRLDAGKLTLRVQHSYGKQGTHELASLALAGSFAALGLVGLASAVAVRDVTAGGTFLGLPFWSGLLAVWGGLSFLGAAFGFWRMRG